MGDAIFVKHFIGVAFNDSFPLMLSWCLIYALYWRFKRIKQLKNFQKMNEFRVARYSY